MVPPLFYPSVNLGGNDNRIKDCRNGSCLVLQRELSIGLHIK